jgi:pentatricopeptide repeat protein
MQQADKVLEVFETMKNKCVEFDIATIHVLIDACSKAGYPDLALEFFHKIPRWGFEKEILSYNTLLKSRVEHGQIDDAKRIYDEIMRKPELEPNSYTFTTMISAYMQRQQHELAFRIVEDMASRGQDLSRPVSNALIDGYSQLGMFDKCVEIIDIMKAQGVTPDHITYTSLLKNCRFGGKQALQSMMVIYKAMVEQNVQMDIITYTSLVNAAISLGDLEKVQFFYQEMLQRRIKPDAIFLNALLHAYVKMGSLEQSAELFEDLRQRFPNSSEIYNIMMHGYLSKSQYSKVFEVAKMFRETKAAASEITFKALVQAFSKAPNYQSAMITADFFKSSRFRPQELIWEFNSHVKNFLSPRDAYEVRSILSPYLG